MKLSQLIILILSLAAVAIGQSLVFAILPPLGREIALSELQITGIIACSALVFAIASPRWGYLSDRVGRKPLILLGLGGYTVGTLVFASMFHLGMAGLLGGALLYITLLAVRGVQAVIMAAAPSSCTAYAADNSSPAQRMRTMAKMGTANSIGHIVGPAVGGVLAAFGLLFPLFFAGLLAFTAALLIWFGLPKSTRPRMERAQRPRMRYRDVRIFRYLLAAICIFIGFSSIQQTLGFQLQDKLQLDGVTTAQVSGAALMINAMFMLLMQLTASQRLKWEPDRFIRVGLTLCVASTAFIVLFQKFSTLAVGMALMGAGLGLALPAILAGASLAVGHDEQGAVAGMISSCPALGFIIGPLAGGALYQWHPPTAPLFGALVLAALLIYLLMTRPRREPA